jgi:hypothetical protein
MRSEKRSERRGRSSGVALTVANSRALVARALLLLVIAGLGAARLASAQSPNGTVRGTILDPSDRPVPAATVTLTHLDTGARRTATTSTTGGFAISLVPPGTHRLDISAPGFRSHVHQLTLRVGEDFLTTVALQVGNVSEQVEVTAPLVDIARGTAALGTRIGRDELMALPLDGRNFLELALLAPGVQASAQGAASTVRGDFAVNINGARDDATAYLLDGANNLDPKLNTPGVRPPVDAIREFEVVTGSYDAAFGRHAGGLVNIATRSGSNALQGSAYGFFRNEALDSRNVFASSAASPAYSRRQMGGTLGGPVVSNRAFFFGSYEGTRTREAITRLTTVPTAAERTGDFSRSLQRAPFNPFTQQPFPGAQIPAFFQNPVGRAIAALYPLPNRADARANYVASPTSTDAQDQFDAKVTILTGASGTLNVRHSLGDRRLLEPFAGIGFSSVEGFGNDVDRRAQNSLVNHVHVLSSSLVNDAKFGYTRIASSVVPENRAEHLNATVGLPDLSPNPRDYGLTFITVTGFSALGDEYNNPQESTTQTFQFADAMTWTRGAHLAKFGVDVVHTQQEAFRDVQSRGLISFTDRAYTGNALADLLLGLPSVTAGARLDNPQRLRATQAGFFVQDDWRLHRTVTLNAGLRYELFTPPHDVDDRASLYDPTTGSVTPVGTAGVPRGGYSLDKNNVAPRVGLSWTPEAAPSTVIRGGYGVYYNQSALAPSEGLYFNSPYYDFNFYVPLQSYVISLADPFPASYPLFIPDSATAMQSNFRTPYWHQWSASVQHGLWRNAVGEAAYVGSRGRSLVRARDLNQAAASAAPLNLRPNPFYADITYLESAGRSRYDALQLKLTQRDVGGLSALASYTFGKSSDNASGFFASAGDPNLPQDSNDPEAEWGRSSFDARHRFSLGFSYQVPSPDAGGLAWLASGWQVAGIVTLQSGRPFTVALLPDFDNSNTGRASLGLLSNDRPNTIGDPTLGNPTAARWFNTGAFALPQYGTFGNTGRNTVEGPGYANTNVALIKVVRMDRRELQLRLEAFNLFNRANYDQPDNFFGSPTFGQILSAQAPRRLQLGVRATF